MTTGLHSFLSVIHSDPKLMELIIVVTEFQLNSSFLMKLEYLTLDLRPSRGMVEAEVNSRKLFWFLLLLINTVY